MSRRNGWRLALGVGRMVIALAGGPAIARCTSDADCEDGNPCTANTCTSRGRCRNPQPLEVPQFSCFINQPPGPCAVDICTATAVCRRVPKCNDANPCTDDSCDALGTCSYAPRADG